MPKFHRLGIQYAQPDAASAANRLGAKVADAWDTFVAAVRAIDGCGEIEIIDKVMAPEPAGMRALHCPVCGADRE